MKQEKKHAKMEPIINLIWTSEYEIEDQISFLTVGCVSDSCFATHPNPTPLPALINC